MMGERSEREMIEWKELPKQAQEELEEETFLIYLSKSARALSAVHDAANKCFFIATDEEDHIYPYRYVSHYAEMDWPDTDDGPMIDWCEHGNMLVCEECAKSHRGDRDT
jgi:hypothetical protein